MIKVLQPCLLVLFIGSSLSGFSQENNQAVIAAAGDVSKSSNLVLEWTLGEAVVETASSSAALYTQGFHQPLLEVQKIPAPNLVMKNIFHVFPNPTTSVLNIQLEDISEARLLVTLVDANGRVLINNEFPPKSNLLKIDVKRFTHGTYFLRITDAKGAITGQFKVIKAL